MLLLLPSHELRPRLQDEIRSPIYTYLTFYYFTLLSIYTYLTEKTQFCPKDTTISFSKRRLFSLCWKNRLFIFDFYFLCWKEDVTCQPLFFLFLVTYQPLCLYAWGLFFWTIWWDATSVRFNGLTNLAINQRVK